MSRSLFDRARLAGSDDPLDSVLLVARLDVAAQNHALAEGTVDPYPRPDEWGCGPRAHAESAHGRVSLAQTGGGVSYGLPFDPDNSAPSRDNRASYGTSQRMTEERS